MDIRYQEPTNLERAPYAKVCKVIHGYEPKNIEESFYIQISKNEEDPKWILIEQLLKDAFKHRFNDSDFIQKCLEMAKMEWGNTA